MRDAFEEMDNSSNLPGTTLSTVRSGPMQTEVWTEPNLQVLGSVPCKGGPDPYLQVRGPGMSGPDLRVEPGLDLKNILVSSFNRGQCHISHKAQTSPVHQI